MNAREEHLVLHRETRERRRQAMAVLAVFSVMVAVIVFWWLKLTGITMTGDALCGTEEHIHSASCYEYTLICTDEDETHEHTADCVNEELICIITEHTHTRECYEDVAYEVLGIEGDEVEAEQNAMYADGDDASTHEYEDDIYEGNIRYTSHLDDEVVGVSFKDGDHVLDENDSIYLGHHYTVSLSFSEILSQTENKRIQFVNNENGQLTYYLPENINCDPFEDWHELTATRDGVTRAVGRYKVVDDENGHELLLVEFYEQDNLIYFDKYTNTKFTVEFGATVTGTMSGTDKEVDFGENIKVSVTIDGGAEIKTQKERTSYDVKNNQLEYKIVAEVTKGAVENLVIDDSIWVNQQVILDTVVVTDLDGNVLDPQPNIRRPDNPNGMGANGFTMDGFEKMFEGEGLIITYKTQLFDEAVSGESVYLWNGAYFNGTNGIGGNVYAESAIEETLILKNLTKTGKQDVINGVSVIKWTVNIKNSAENMRNEVVIDTLGEGLAYYTGEKISVVPYNQVGKALDPVEIDWNDVVINNGTMKFNLPDGYAFDIVYYTTYQEPEAGKELTFNNEVRVTINGEEEKVQGNTNVVGFVPRVDKTVWGNDGDYVYYNIEVNVPGTLKDVGNFYFSDYAYFWSQTLGTVYINNAPENLKITATLKDGQVVTFTPYVEGGPTENTYILQYPAVEWGETLYHTFKVYFNTSEGTVESSKWIHDQDAVLNVSYRIPFDAKTGRDWSGEYTGETVGDVLAKGEKLSNDLYFNYKEGMNIADNAVYDYYPPITKKGTVNQDGTIDYTVRFHNTVPGSNNQQGYINAATSMVYFNDIFDERLEYVPESLVVTVYSAYQKDLWIAKFKHSGTNGVQGNTLNIPSADLKFLDYNEAADAYDLSGYANAANFNDYFHWNNGGGDYIFTYKLRVKEDYLKTTEYSHYYFDNTAELTWDDGGTSGPVTEEVEFETGLLEKAVEQHGDHLKFQVRVNRNGLDLLEGSDILTVTDDMSPNLAVYWDTIKLRYKNEAGEWVDFTPTDEKYKYEVFYDATDNLLTFKIPDELPIIIDYTTLVTEKGEVPVVNTVKVDGKANVSDIIDAEFKVTTQSGSASGSMHNFTLIKQDGITNSRLPNAKFALYAWVDAEITPPDGVARTIRSADGKRDLYYIGTYTTGEDGTQKIENQYLVDGGPYALVELEAPEGYQLMQNPVEFYFYTADPDGVTQTVTTLLAVENFNVGYILPETGSVGTLPFTICGLCLMAFPLLYRIQKRRKERRAKL